MAIATQSVSPAYVGRGVTVASTSFTIKSALTISAGSGLRLRVMACISRSEISTYDGGGITWNGVALTKIGTPTTGGSGEYCVHWELIAPTPGTGDIIITSTVTTNDGTFWWIVETGTNGSPATGYALENYSATSATPAATVPAGASAIVCGASFAYATATPGVLSGTTQIGTNESHRYCGQRTDAAAPGVGTWASANQVAAFTSVVGAEASAPVITGPSGAAGASTSAKSVAEGVTAVHTFTADVAVSWSKNGGADEADFTINPSTGALAFAAAPDFEGPGDSDTNNTYVVVVRATATVGGATADQTVTVTVTNASEPPLAPTIGTATAGNTTASVAFTPPSNTGRPAISGYTATSSPGGITGTGASSPITVSGLTNGTAYTFTVTATNADGTGPASAASNSVTPSPGGDATLPTLTGSIAIGTVTSSSIQMSWPAGSDNTAVTSYEVSSNGGSSYADVGAVLTHTFTGLTASTSYDLRVRAKDAAGNVSTPDLAATQSTGAAAVAGFGLDTAAGCVFGAIAGSLTSISREVGVAYKVAVYNTSTRALIFESATLTTNSAGRLSRFTTGLCTIGVTYDLVAKRVSDGAIACFRLAAT